MEDDLSMAWLDWCRAEGVSPNTINARARVLRSIGNAGTASREDVETWWESRRGLSPATRSNDLACLRSFYRWCRRWEHRDDDPTLRLDAPRVDKGLPHPMSRADLHRLLADLPDDLRRAVALGAYAGLRVAEAAALRWSQVDVEARTLDVVAGKGGKSRRVAVSALLIDHLLPVVDGAYVVSGTGSTVTGQVLQKRVNRAIRAAGVDETFHALRHRFGTLAYQATRDLVAVQRAMGHASPVTTTIYAQASDEAAVEIANAVAR